MNRVGWTRKELVGSIAKFGFFTEFTQESFDFDSDSELYGHLSRELVTGATQLTEAVLQSDLLNGAGVVLFAGAATTPATVTGEGARKSDKLDRERRAAIAALIDAWLEAQDERARTATHPLRPAEVAAAVESVNVKAATEAEADRTAGSGAGKQAIATAAPAADGK